MCRLLGLVANKLVDFKFSLELFKEKFSDENPDGWGVAWYENNSPRLEKQGISATDERSRFQSFSEYVESRIIMAHVRKSTGAPAVEVNSHPFKCNDWIFAHNGSVNRENLLPLLKEDYSRNIKGETDSEVYFHWILQNIQEHDIISGVKEALEKVMESNFTGLNFLLSDGKSFYAFRYSEINTDYYSLFKLKRKPSEISPLTLKSQETRMLIETKSLNKEKAVIVCSEKLTEENWEKIKMGHMLIIKPNLKMKEVKIL
ncbi:MAG: class II glutamine amidotransferase [Methanothermobacter sp.]